MIKVLSVLCACGVAVMGGQIGRVMSMSRYRMPSAFRPGVSLSRPWAPPPPRLMQSASHRTPYVVYRSPNGHRYIRPYMSNSIRGYTNSPWRTSSKIPSSTSVTPEYEFVRAASATPSIILHSDGGTGAIHTIPAPNLSLSEKPIVVMDSSDDVISSQSAVKTEMKPAYILTDTLPKSMAHNFGKPVIEPPALLGLGMSKATQLTAPELSSFVKNGAALHLAAEYGMPAIAVPQTSIQMPQQFTLQGYNGILPEPQQTVADASLQNLVFQPDQLFLQKLQNQLYQRFPGVEFVPYQAEPEPQPQFFIVNTEEPKKQTIDHKNVVREAQEGTVVTLVPQIVNVTENLIQTETKATTEEPKNVTYALVSETQPSSSTTVKYIVETTTEQDKSTPIYYAQVGQSVGDAVANGFYSAINEVRAAAAMAQVETPQEDNNRTSTSTTTTSTTTINPEMQTIYIRTDKPETSSQTITELKPLRGVPFSKVEPVNVAYTVLRADDTKPKIEKDGTVYAGQIVEASVSEDQEFNKEKAANARHPPLRLFAVTENKETTEAPKLTVVKAKIPPKSKLTFDDKTGEPVLRIYASYVDSPLQKEIIASKLSNIKHMKEIVVRKQDSVNNWKSSSLKKLDKKQTGSDANQVTEFGLKLRPRMDDYVSIFEDYES